MFHFDSSIELTIDEYKFKSHVYLWEGPKSHMAAFSLHLHGQVLGEVSRSQQWHLQ